MCPFKLQQRGDKAVPAFTKQVNIMVPRTQSVNHLQCKEVFDQETRNKEAD